MSVPRPVRPRHGIVLGKFLPPHLGHVYLVDFARRYADELTVIVGSLAAEPIAGELRRDWARELFPDSEVLHLTDENPQDPSEHPEFWRIWRESLRRILKKPVDLVFASERYGHRLAHELDATFVAVDPLRTVIPVSGTAIRNDPLRHFAYLPPCVRAYFVRRVCIFGPESTGKSTLARELAAHFDTIAVPEYARTYLTARADAAMALVGAPASLPPTPLPVYVHDMEPIARGQLAAEAALARQASRVLFCDTDVLTTQLWSETLFGTCTPWLREQAQRARYDLTLLCDVDVPWVADPVRYLPGERESFFNRCQAALAAAGRPYVVLRGSWEERRRCAIAAVAALPGATAACP